MAWTYTAEPATVPRDAVRYRVGDTDEGDQLVGDGEIDWELTEAAGRITLAAARVCRAIAARFSRRADTADGDVRISYSQRARAYADRAEELEAAAKQELAAGLVPRPFAGGTAPPVLRPGMHDNTE